MIIRSIKYADLSDLGCFVLGFKFLLKCKNGFILKEIQYKPDYNVIVNLINNKKILILKP